MKDTKSGGCAKVLLFAVSVGLAVGVFVLMIDRRSNLNEVLGLGPEYWPLALMAAVAVLVGYPIVAACMVRLCAGLRAWAYCKQVEEWDDERRLLVGAFWPVSLLVSLVVYLFLGFVHRIF